MALSCVCRFHKSDAGADERADAIRARSWVQNGRHFAAAAVEDLKEAVSPPSRNDRVFTRDADPK